MRKGFAGFSLFQKTLRLNRYHRDFSKHGAARSSDPRRDGLLAFFIMVANLLRSILLFLAPLLAHAVYPGNFALIFNASHGDVLRVPHESSMQGPLIDSFTVELWLLVKPRAQLAPLQTTRIVNLVGFPGRHPFVGLASDTGCAMVQLKLTNGSWYSYEGTTPVDDGEWHHVSPEPQHKRARTRQRVPPHDFPSPSPSIALSPAHPSLPLDSFATLSLCPRFSDCRHVGWHERQPLEARAGAVRGRRAGAVGD